MIVCSSCGNRMEDGLRFCTECGAVNPTISFSAPRNSQSEATLVHNQFGNRAPMGGVPPSGYANPPVAPSRTPLIVAAVLVGAVVLLLAGGVGAYFLFQNNQSNQNQGMQASAPSPPPSPRSAATATPYVSPVANRPAATQSQQPPQPTNPQPLDSSALKREVVETLNGWAAAASAHDLDGQMSYYADTLHTYFTHRNVNVQYVRSNRKPAFTNYYKLDVQLSNIDVTVDSSGTMASATLDKTYRFDGAKVLSGSVQQMVWLEKIAGRWRITGERDLRVYYTNK